MKFIPRLVGVCMASIALSAMAKAPNIKEPWPSKLVTYFEMFCYQTDATLSRAVAMAEILEMREIAQEKLAPMMPLNDVDEGRGYILEHSEADQKGIFMLVVTNQDACSVAGMGINYDEVIESMSENYRLREFVRDDIGLQINTFYIPGGTSGHIKEVHRRGIIGILTNKPGESTDTITLSYIPPRSAQESF